MKYILTQFKALRPQIVNTTKQGIKSPTLDRPIDPSPSRVVYNGKIADQIFRLNHGFQKKKKHYQCPLAINYVATTPEIELMLFTTCSLLTLIMFTTNLTDVKHFPQ